MLGLEVLAARTMAPAIGSGSVAWSCLLAVALGTLAAGNLLGGLLADRAPPGRILVWTLVIAAAALAGMSQLYPPAMRWAAGLPVIRASILAAVLTQLAPMLMLGTVSPTILAAGRASGPGGRWAGAVLACASAGGIAGALTLGLAALPAVGIARSYLILAAALALTAGPAAAARRRWLAGLVALLILLAVVALWLFAPRPDVIQSRYGQIEVRRDEASATLLIDGLPQTGMRGPIEPWAGLRHGYLLEAAVMFADRPREALVIGLGGGLASRLLEAHGLNCLSVEIDPAVVEVARREFGFDGAVAVADGRPYLARARRRWDIIFVDVCTADRLPGHLFTVEALRLMRRRLAPGGVLAIQFIGGDDPWSASLIATVREVFGDCLALTSPRQLAPVGPQWVFAGGSTPLARPDDNSYEPATPWRAFVPRPPGRLLTDDHFPVELHWARTAQLWRRLYAEVN